MAIPGFVKSLNSKVADNALAAHGYAGPSSSDAPYYLALNPQVKLASIITTGDTVPELGGLGSFAFGGTPDGLGAYDNPGSTFTLLVNHELRPAEGAEHDHGGTGAYISKLIIDEQTLQVVGGDDLIKSVFLWQNGSYVESDDVQFNRFCSGDLPKGTALYNPVSGKGYDGQIYLNGEETAEGRAFAHFATGAEAGHSYELAYLGNLAFENVVASPTGGDKTLVFAMDDTSPRGQVYFYMGDKQSTGTAVEKAGLAGGDLYGIKVLDAPADEVSATGLGGEVKAFSLVKLGEDGDVSTKSAQDLQTQSEQLGVTEFLRPEDGAWDTADSSRFYFVTTDSFNGHSRLWRLDFDDANHPENGGKIELMVDGGPYHMFDNITVNSHGQVLIEEDPGNQLYSAKIWLYDPQSDHLGLLAQSNPQLFGSDVLNLAPSAPFTQDEEASGIIDVTDILGSNGKDVYLFDVQAHYPNADPALVEGGQLLAMSVNLNSLPSWDWAI